MTCSAVLGSGLALAPASAGAQGTSGGLSVVNVTATRSPAIELGVPASVTVVDAQALAEREVVRFGDAIAGVPGVYVRGSALGRGFPSSGQAVLSLRGIPRTPRTLVLVDGQPVNNALSGGINVAGIPADALGRVEVVRGPYSALYGGNAMGGVVNFITAGADQPLDEIRLGAGNLGQRGASFVHRRRYDGGLGVHLALGYRESDDDPRADYTVRTPATGTTGTPVTGAIRTTTTSGAPAWWVGTKGARPWQQENVHLSFDYAFGGTTKLAAGAAWARYSNGYAPFETFLRDAAGNPVFSGAVTFNDGGPRRLTLSESNFVNFTPSSERDLRLFTRLEHRFAGGTVLNANLGQLRHRFRFVMPTFGVAGYDDGPGEHTDQPNQRVDLDASLRIPMSGSWVLVTGGALGRASLDRNTADLALWRDESTRGTLRTESRGTAVNQALFVQSEHFLDHGLTAYFGARYDRFETWGEVVQYTAPAFAQSYDRRSFERLSPKVALVWSARPWLSLRASLGSGFRPPALLDLYSRSASPTATAGVVSVNEASPDLLPERVSAFEVGADAALAGGGRASVTLYRQRLSDLIYRRRISATLTRTENAAQADVDGIEASVSWPTAVRGLTAFGSLTHQLKYEITRNDAVPESVGKNLTDVPRTMGTLGLRMEGGRWTGSLSYRYTSRVFASGDDLNQNTARGVYGAYDAHGIVSAKVEYRIDKNLSFSLAMDNLTNHEYFVFNRQPGRTVYGEFAYRF